MSARGSFVEAPSDPHVARRRAVLERERWYPEPSMERISLRASGVLAAADRVRANAEDTGIAAVDMDRPLTTDEFVALGRMLGTPVPERAPAVQPFVEAAVVLNVVLAYENTRDVDRQPFSENALTLHTESSPRPLCQQPRFLVFQCLAAPSPHSGGQTILARMESIGERVQERTRTILGGTFYEGSSETPPFLRSSGSRLIFAFRDFAGEPIQFRSTISDDAEEVRDGVRDLLSSLYDPAATMGIHWRPNALIVLDNTRFFHGRTRGSLGAGRRLLQRLRILAPTGDDRSPEVS